MFLRAARIVLDGEGRTRTSVGRPGLGDSRATLLAATTINQVFEVCGGDARTPRHHFPRKLRSNQEWCCQMHARSIDQRQRARVEDEARHADAQAVPAS